jgi:hypothetical protein
LAVTSLFRMILLVYEPILLGRDRLLHPLQINLITDTI